MTDRRNTWNNEYSSGKWEVLKSAEELERFEAVLNMVRKYSTKPSSILDIGCGEGLLREKLSPEEFSFYYGVDISSVAINRARDLYNHKSGYEVQTMEDFKTDALFDFIIFNESIYYAENPVFQFARYARYLSTEGMIIISLFETSSNMKLLGLIDHLFTPVDTIITINKRGTWHCQVFDFRPRVTPV
jgi:2-polyprenyl-3-methyl-5-hydroxy-6-metoxy-1,4-benzoquinol methylase